MKKSVIRIVSFFLLIAIVLGGTNQVFKVKYGDGIYGLTKFYELEEDSFDVLILGSSHAFEDFNTGTLWDEYGMASYVLAGSVQPMWNTYYYLREALKTQNPELIVLEGYCTTFSSEYIDDSRIIKNNFGLKASQDKIDSIKASAPKERWYEFLLEYMQYHTRYNELSSADFLQNQGNRLYDDWKGFGCNMVTTSYDTWVDAKEITDRAALYEKTEEYYRKTIELAKENDIPIVVVISPYAGLGQWDQQIFNTASDIAGEYGVDCLNCNLLLDEIGIDWKTDAADVGHLNYRGSQKYSNYIGNWLKENFIISDRRGDDRYDSWQRDADYINELITNQELVETTNLNDISQKLNNENYWTMVSLDGNADTTNEDVLAFLASLGIINATNGIWMRQGSEIAWSILAPDEVYFISNNHDFCAKQYKDEEENIVNDIIIDNISYKKVVNGVNVVVWDTKTESVADVFGLDADNAYSLVR